MAMLVVRQASRMAEPTGGTRIYLLRPARKTDAEIRMALQGYMLDGYLGNELFV